MAGRRRDAERNRGRLVEAAREVFAERGMAATLDDIAERAGVGTGTAYRHFRNKQELAAEVLGDATRQIALDAEQALLVDDPWLAIVAFFETTARRQAADRGLYQALAGLGRVDDKVDIWPKIVASVTKLFDNAKEARVIRPDAQPDDAVMILAMLGPLFGTAHAGRNGHPAPWPRYLALLLDGLRATDRPQLPVDPPTFDSLDDMIAASKPLPLVSTAMVGER